MFRKYSKAVLVLLGALLVFSAGCSSKKEEATDETGNKGSTSKPVEISFAFWKADDPNGQREKQVLDEVIQQYEQKTNVKINFNFLPTKDYRTWMTTQYAANNIPDVFITRREWSFEDYNMGLIQDLGPYMDQESPYSPGKKWKDTLIPSLYASSIDTSNQVISSVPQNVATIKFIYNKDLFAKAGITELPSTWEEFVEACEKLKNSGITPIGFANASSKDQEFHWYLLSIWGQLDQELRNKMDMDGDGWIFKNEMARATDQGMIDFSQAPYKDGLELLKELSKYFNSDFNAVDTNMNLDNWFGQRTAMMMIGSWSLVNIEEMQGRNFDYGVFSFPMITEATHPNPSGKVTIVGGIPTSTWSISKQVQGEKLDAAVDFLQYLASPEVQGKFATDMYYMPIVNELEVPDVQKGFMVKDYEESARANYTGPATSQEFSDFLIRTGQLYLTEKIDIEKFTKELNTEWKKAMDSAKKASNWTEENNYGLKK